MFLNAFPFLMTFFALGYILHCWYNKLYLQFKAELLVSSKDPIYQILFLENEEFGISKVFLTWKNKKYLWILFKL